MIALHRSLVSLRVKPLVQIMLVALLAGFGMQSCSGMIGDELTVRIALNRSQISENDTLSVLITFSANDNAEFTLHDDFSRSLRLFIRGGDGEQVDYNDVDFEYTKVSSMYTERGDTQPILLGPNQERTVIVRGVVLESSPDTGIVIDFGDFGIVSKDVQYPALLVSVRYYPALQDMSRFASSSFDIYSNDKWVYLD